MQTEQPRACPVRVLLIGFPDEVALGVEGALRAGGRDIVIERADGLRRILELLDEHWNAVLMLSGDEGFTLEALETGRQKQMDIPFLVLTESADDAVALEALRRGADDCVLMSNLSRLGPALERAFRETALKRSHHIARGELAEYRSYLEDLVESRTNELRTINRRCEREIALHRRTVQALTETENRFRHLAEMSPDIIGRFDRSCRHIYVNRAAAEITGLPQSAFLGKSNREMGMPGEFCDRTEAALKNVFETGESTRLEFEMDTTSGRRTFEAHMAPDAVAGAKVQSVISICRDVTERAKREDTLAKEREMLFHIASRQSEELEDAEREVLEAKRLADIGTLAATVAHELRNPLGVIQTAVYNIRRKRRNSAIDRHLDNIEKKIAESDLIINNLLGYSRMRAPDKAPVDLGPLVRRVIEEAGGGLVESGPPVEMDIGALEGVLADVDAVQIGEVIVNILNNAYQAVAENGGSVRVTAARPREEVVEVAVEDTGPGIHPDDLERVFDPFFTTRCRGTGLGLTLSRQMARRHGGDLGLFSEPGRGTRAVLGLPLRKGTS
jgi:PAS domain S-box-containing protein